MTVRLLHLALFLFALILPACSSNEAMPSPDAPEATQFGYASPEAALAALRNAPGVQVSERDGWTVVEDRPHFTFWTFTPKGHAAYPAGVKRVLVKASNGDISVRMNILCYGTKAACDKLADDFRQLNERMAADIRTR